MPHVMAIRAPQLAAPTSTTTATLQRSGLGDSAFVDWLREQPLAISAPLVLGGSLLAGYLIGSVARAMLAPRRP